MIARLRARLRSQAGFTLTEMLVAASVGTVVLMGVFTLLDTSVKQSTGVNARIDSTQRGRTAMEQITRELRSQVCFAIGAGTPASLTAASDYSVTFYYFNKSVGPFAPERRTLFWDTNSNSIKETIEPPVGTPPNITGFGTPTTRTVATNVKPPPNGATSDPVFEYYRTGAITRLATPVSAANLPLVSQIKVRFRTDTGVVGSSSTSATAYSTSYASQVFVRTADPNGLAGSTDPDCS